MGDIEKRNEIILKAIGHSINNNCYMTFEAIQEGIDQGKLLVFFEENIVVLLEKKNSHYKLYYFLSQKNKLDGSWEDLKIKLKGYRPLKLELLTKTDKAINNIVVSNLDFALYKIYIRKRILDTRLIRPYKVKMDVEFARLEDTDYIYGMLLDTFDLIADYIFDEREELVGLILNRNVLKVVLAGEIAGVLVFEDTKCTSYLQALCIKERCRNNGVGSSLLAKYINMHLGSTELFYLWVDKDNVNALGLYNKFGYKEDGLKDNIYIKR